MLTAFQTRKLNRLFSLYDADGNGILEESDYEAVAQNGARALGYEPGTAEYATLHGAYMGIWQGVRQLANNDDKLTLDGFLAAYDKLISQREIFNAVILDMARMTIEFQDKNKDGKVDLAEHVAYDMAHNISRQDAEASFLHLDRDGDGYLTKSELIQDIDEFFYSDDPQSPGNWLLGPF